MIRNQQLNGETLSTPQEEREEYQQTIKDYTKTTAINKLLAWNGMDKLDNRITNGLNISQFIPGSNQIKGTKKYKIDCPKWSERQTHNDIIIPRSCSPISFPNDGTNHQSNDLNEESMGLPVSSVPGCSNSIGGDEDENSGNILCAWCQKIGAKVYSLRTENGFKVFCSELCFAQCRRASFKKNKVCDWCKHIRHTVNYVEFQNGEQSLQFCSDKCLNQYKMNIFCRETRAHLDSFSAVYRSPSPSSNYSASKIFRSSNDLPESDRINSTDIESLQITPNLWPRHSNFSKITSTTSISSSRSSSSFSPSPNRSSSPIPSSSESQCLSISSFGHSRQNDVLCPPPESKGFNDPKPELLTDTSKETFHQNDSLNKKPKIKIVDTRDHRSNLVAVTKIVTDNIGKQRPIKSLRNLINNRENVIEQNVNENPDNSKSNKKCGSAISNFIPSFSNHFDDGNHSTNSSTDENGFNFSPTIHHFPNHCLSNLPMKMPQFSSSHQLFHPSRTEFLRLRQPHPMFPFNQNFFRLPGHHRPPFPPVPVNHHSNYCPIHEHPSCNSPVSLPFQRSPIIGQSNNHFHHPGSLPVPVPHPFLLPLPMPIPLPIPFPIRFNSSNFKTMISTEDKEVQVGASQELSSQLTSNYRQNDSVNGVRIDRTTINHPNRENPCRFRIDTLMNKLINKKMRATSEPVNGQSNERGNNCNPINLKRTRLQSYESGSNSNDDSKISNNFHEDSYLLKTKKFKQDILFI